MNYVADIRGDLILAGFETAATAPGHLDEHDLNLSSERIQEIAPVTTPALDLEHTAASKDWRFNPTTEATNSPVLEPHMDLTSHDIRVTRTLDSSPAISSEPCEPADVELDCLSIFEFSTADIFQHLPLGDVLNSLKNLSLAGGSQPNYIRFELEADDREFRSPPTTHFIATVEDLTDALDYDSEDIVGMDDDADEEQGQNPPFIGRWTATSSYDVYMVDTPKATNDDDKENPVENKPPETLQKRRSPRRHSKSRRSKEKQYWHRRK